MLRRIAVLVPLLGLLALGSGCAVNRATANVSPDADIGKMRSFYVVKVPEDQRSIDKLITDNLQKRGFTATSGPQPQKAPAGVDALVTYNDKWMWDMTMYMLELTIQLRNPSNNFPMATGNSFHTSLTRKSPPEMVDEVLTNIFNAQTKK
jgi:hypothetical protein